MEFTINIKDSAKAKAFLNFIKSLDFVTIRESGDEIPEWQQEQLDKALQEHKSGTTTYTEWDKVKKELLDQYKDK